MKTEINGVVISWKTYVDPMCSVFTWLGKIKLGEDRELSMVSYPNNEDGYCPQPTDEPYFQLAYYVGRRAVEIPDRFLKGIIPDGKLEFDHTFLDYLTLDQIEQICQRMVEGGYVD